MDPFWHEHFRQRLLEERERYEKLLAGLYDTGLSMTQGEAFKEHSLYDNHPADAGTETFEREKNLGLAGGYRDMLGKIDYALNALKEGSYGFCQHCGRPIGAERLQIVPMATLCTACQAERERGFDTSGRPIEEEVLHPPFGRTFTDGTENNAYDGEDAWQDVAPYGNSETPQDAPPAQRYDDMYADAEDPR